MGTIIDKQAWAEEFLKTLGNPNPDPLVIKFVWAWEILESGPGPVVAADHNPLNTTQAWPGATNFNAVGVKNYASYQDGLNATATVLKNSLYPSLLHALQTNDTLNLGMSSAPMAPNIIGDLSVWSTGVRVPANSAYAQHIASLAGQSNLPAGGNIGQVQAGGPSASDVLSSLNTLTSASTWIRVGLFLLAVVAILIGGYILLKPELGAATQDATKAAEVAAV